VRCKPHEDKVRQAFAALAVNLSGIEHVRSQSERGRWVTYPQAGMHFRHTPPLISQHALYQPPVEVWEVSAQPCQIVLCIKTIHIITFMGYT